MHFFLITVVVLLVVAVLWRFSSKRYMLPCPSYLAWMVEVDNPFAKENRSANIIEHLEIKSNIHVADVGCGPGRVTIPLSHKLKKNSTLVAVDIQNTMLEKVKRKAVGLTNIEFRQGALGMGDTILEKSTYDYILLVNVLGEIPNQKKAMQEIFHALMPNGILSVTETIFDPHYQRIKRLEALAAFVGFKKSHVFGKWHSYTAHFIAAKPQES